MDAVPRSCDSLVQTVRVSPAYSLDGNYTALGRGAWGLWCFETDPEERPAPDQLPREPVDLANLIAHLRADAAIVSWYDNDDWLVAWTSS
jgi:hypothetical protein